MAADGEEAAAGAGVPEGGMPAGETGETVLPRFLLFHLPPKSFSFPLLSGNSNFNGGGGGGGSSRGNGGSSKGKPKEITVHSPGPTLGSRLLRTGGEEKGGNPGWIGPHFMTL